MSTARIMLTTVAFATSSLATASTPVHAEAWEVDGRLLKAGGGKADDLSGIACDTPTGFPRDCLVIDDETQWAQWVRLEEGRLVAGDTLPLISDRFGGEALEADGEGVAFANGAFYVIGSHGAPRNGADMSPSRGLARLRADSHLFRITRDGAGMRVDDTPALTSVILTQPGLRDHAASPLDENGVTVEGLAMLGQDTFVGFRGPVLGADDRAAVLQVSTASLFGGEADAGTLHLLALGIGRGVRDLAPFGDELVILAGPGPDTPGTSSIFRWTPADGPAARFVADVPCDADQAGKPEAILPLDLAQATLRLLVLNDGPNEGDPRVCALPWDS